MLAPKLTHLSTTPKGDSITVADTTGAYNATTNPGGYGVPNSTSPPLAVGIRPRYWSKTIPDGQFVSNNAPLITALLSSTGKSFKPVDFGSSAEIFAPGVHHWLYYPLYSQTTVVTLTAGNTLVTVTGGTAPDTWDVAYKGIVFNNGTLSPKVYLIDRTKPVTALNFHVTEAWEGITSIGAAVLLGTEADLKILVQEPAKACVVDRISALFDSCTCNAGEEYELMQDTMQLRAAIADFACADYNGAHNKTAAVYNQCAECKTSCSCS
jgi:hypothetical protein